MTQKEVSKFIKGAVKDLFEADDNSTYKLTLDGDFAIYVGWSAGFDEKDETCLHSKSEPQYCLCAKVAENNPIYEYDWVYMPWYKDGEVYDTDSSIPTDANYNQIAKWLLSSYREMKKLLKKGEISFGS